MLNTVAELFGKFLWKITDDLSSDEETRSAFHLFFQDLPAYVETEPRRLCAFNFPAVLKVRTHAAHECNAASDCRHRVWAARSTRRCSTQCWSN